MCVFASQGREDLSGYRDAGEAAIGRLRVDAGAGRWGYSASLDLLTFTSTVDRRPSTFPSAAPAPHRTDADADADALACLALIECMSKSKSKSKSKSNSHSHSHSH